MGSVRVVIKDHLTVGTKWVRVPTQNPHQLGIQEAGLARQPVWQCARGATGERQAPRTSPARKDGSRRHARSCRHQGGLRPQPLPPTPCPGPSLLSVSSPSSSALQSGPHHLGQRQLAPELAAGTPTPELVWSGPVPWTHNDHHRMLVTSSPGLCVFSWSM